MGREILFRGKRIDNGEWVAGYLLRYSPIFEELTYILPIPAVCVNEVEVDPETVCQYTVLKAEGGKKIWEGDIVELTIFHADGSDSQHICKVMHDECGVIFSENKSKKCFYFSDMQFMDTQSDVRIIGNIFDNPELLEGDEP